MGDLSSLNGEKRTGRTTGIDSASLSKTPQDIIVAGEAEEEVGGVEEEVVEEDGVAMVVEVGEALMEVVEVMEEVMEEVMVEAGGHPEAAEAEVSTTRGPVTSRVITRGTTGTSITSTAEVLEVVEGRDISIRPCWRILGPSWRSITGMEELERERRRRDSLSLERRRTPRYLRLKRTRCLNL